jgi:hypothetical protein
MKWFHKHKWILVAKTYVEPINRSLKFGEGSDVGQWNLMQEWASGVTTFLWKCEDASCDCFRQQKCLGKEVETK